MALQLNRWRRRRAFVLGAISIAMLAGALFVSRLNEAIYAAPAGGVVAAPGLGADGVQTRVISIRSRQGVFSLARTPRGWSLQDRGGYRVDQDKVRAVEAAFREMRLVRPITRDDTKHARLNVGDPSVGGDGVLVQLQDERGAFLVDFILGYREEQIYLRKRGDPQVWTIRGDLPPLRDAAFWLDLKPFGLGTADLQRLDIAPAAGPAYTILRLEPGAMFVLGRPFSAMAITQPAAVEAMLAAIAKVQPGDVAPAPSLGGAPMARLLATAGDGVVVGLDLHRKDGADWLKATARTVPEANAEAMGRAQAINAQAAAWAFRLSAEDAAALIPGLDSLVGTDALERRLAFVPAAAPSPRRAASSLPPRAPAPDPAGVPPPEPAPTPAGPP